MSETCDTCPKCGAAPSSAKRGPDDEWSERFTCGTTIHVDENHGLWHVYTKKCEQRAVLNENAFLQGQLAALRTEVARLQGELEKERKANSIAGHTSNIRCNVSAWIQGMIESIEVANSTEILPGFMLCETVAEALEELHEALRCTHPNFASSPIKTAGDGNSPTPAADQDSPVQ